MKIMVSACLLGENCKYSGGNNYNEKVIAFTAGHTVIPVCPEVLGGLSVPRASAELVNGEAVTAAGRSVDREYRLGAERALEIARLEQPDVIVLQSRSPSCGVRQIYDGSFTGTKIPGQGVFAALAIREGFRVMDAEELETESGRNS